MHPETMMSSRSGNGGGKFFSGGFQESMGEVELVPKHLSDQHIRAQIYERLATRLKLDPDRIDVEVNGGKAVLRGRVASAEQKLEIVKVAESVQGVRTVVNELAAPEAP
jgi:osmotically-inducible protein OsmY